MATLLVPSFKIGRVSLSELEIAKKEMKAAEQEFALQIAQTVKCTGVPLQLGLPFMFLESRCKNVRNKHTSATGLMQLMPETAVDIVCINKKAIKENAELSAILLRLLGGKRFNGYVLPGMDGSTAIKRFGGVSRNDLDNTELNIMLGFLYLRWLIRGHTRTNGSIDIERVIIKYNQGMNAKAVGSSPAQVLLFAKLRYGSEPANYILDMAGKNGYLTAYS